VAFWNVAGLRNKDRDFWKGLENWDVIVLSETWVDEKGWDRIKEKLPKGYKWGTQIAKRRSRKGRAIGEMVMGIRKEVMEKGQEIKSEREGMIEGRVRVGGGKWKIRSVKGERYVKGNLEEVLKDMGGWMEEKKVGSRKLIGGD